MASDILIVDDEVDIRELVAGILQDEGYGTRTAADADQALAGWTRVESCCWWLIAIRAISRWFVCGLRVY